MRILLLLCFASALAATAWVGTGCKGSLQTADSTGAGTIPPEPIDSALDRLNPQFAITQLGPRRYSLTFAVGSGGAPGSPQMAAVRSVGSLAAQIYSPDGTQLASLATQDVNTSGTQNAQNGQQSLVASGGIEWAADTDVVAGTYAVMIARTEKGSVIRRVAFPSGADATPAKPNPDKILHLWIESKDHAGSVEFILHVSRIAPGPEGEYMPSGERFRIELQNGVGETVWSTSRGKAFTGAIGPVEPTEVGREIEYRALWNGRDQSAGGKAAPGVYRIIGSVPAKPTPYIIREEFTWSGR